MRNRKTAYAFILLIVLSVFEAAAQKSYEFVNQSIEEILYALSLHEKITIVCDDTVRGNASFRYSGQDFSRAFDSFLDSARLYVTKDNGVWTVSKIRILSDDEGNVQLDCYDVSPCAVLEKLSIKTGVTIVYDVIPSSPVSVHFSNMSIKDSVLFILNGSGNYEITEKNNSIRIVKINSLEPSANSSNAVCLIETAENPLLFNAQIQKSKAGYAAEVLCALAGKELIQTYKNDAVIDALNVKNKTAEELLSIICLQSNSSWVEDNGVIYLIPLYDSSSVVKNTGKIWKSYTLKYKTAEAVQSIIAQRLQPVTVIVYGKYSFLSFCTGRLHDELSSVLLELDMPDTQRLITLRYIKASSFLKNIPPSFKKEDFKETGDESKLFYTGSDETYALLLNQLDFIDMPVKRIRYDLLVIQYQESKESSFTPSLEAGPASVGDSLVMSAELDSVLDLKCNIVSSFGLTFAAGLQAALKENKAKVFADTTLHGISGSAIKFQNTSTYRYRENAVNAETGKPASTGITREIISGLVLDVEGWVSGDGMISTTVSASVSKRGADVSNAIGNPPPTYEKVITTQVRSKSGVPVVLSGLVQDDDVIIQERIPFLSKVPLLGLLFGSQTRTNERTEMVIYLIPHIQPDEENESAGMQEKSNSAEIKNGQVYSKYIRENTNE